MTRLALHLHDEIPAVGCGFRVVELVRIGPKWATVRAAGVGHRVKVRRDKWDAICAARRNRAAAADIRPGRRACRG